MADNTYTSPGTFQDVADPTNPPSGAIQVNAAFLNPLVAGVVSANADATTSYKGAVQLAGDLAGTAGSPTVPGLPKNLATAKGQVFVATAAGVASVLGVGGDGQQLIADSTTSTGLRWVSNTVPMATLSIPGILTAGPVGLDFPLIGTWKIDAFMIRVNVAPSTGPVTVDLLLNGASVYGATSANAPSIASSGRNAAGGALTTSAASGTTTSPAALDISVLAADGTAAGLVAVVYGHKTA